jgi:hypothetical protein
MKKVKIIIFMLMVSLTISFMYLGLKSQTPNMINFLEHEGYPNGQVESVNPFMNQVKFKTDSGYVSVRSYKGIYQIQY